jgi:methylenetetrahydrofolate dehydrogenase (NADP+)/methenyltetrahydrofolate cyclohydrolase
LNADRSGHGICCNCRCPRTSTNCAPCRPSPGKDVDGFTAKTSAASQGRAVLAPCTPSGCLYLLEQACGDLRGKHAVVIGRSNIVGKPMAALLLQGRLLGDRGAFAQPRRQALCRQADIVIAAVGRPR